MPTTTIPTATKCLLKKYLLEAFSLSKLKNVSSRYFLSTHFVAVDILSGRHFVTMNVLIIKMLLVGILSH